jgi:protein-S-isoprenylcysteine O-methyltransferase Ste14
MLTGIPYIFSLAYQGYWTYLIKPYMLVPVPGSLLAVIGLTISYGLCHFRVQGEEKMLLQHFGSEWKQHASTRWRFIPFVI